MGAHAIFSIFKRFAVNYMDDGIIILLKAIHQIVVGRLRQGRQHPRRAPLLLFRVLLAFIRNRHNIGVNMAICCRSEVA